MRDLMWDMRKHGHSFISALAILWMGSSDRQKEMLEVLYKEDIEDFKITNERRKCDERKF